MRARYRLYRACARSRAYSVWNSLGPLKPWFWITGTVGGVGLLGLLTTGCTNPVGPTRYTCYTQPRLYWNPITGLSTVEIDHYDSATACPVVPIS